MWRKRCLFKKIQIWWLWRLKQMPLTDQIINFSILFLTYSELPSTMSTTVTKCTFFYLHYMPICLSYLTLFLWFCRQCKSTKFHFKNPRKLEPGLGGEPVQLWPRRVPRERDGGTENSVPKGRTFLIRVADPDTFFEGQIRIWIHFFSLLKVGYDSGSAFLPCSIPIM